MYNIFNKVYPGDIPLCFAMFIMFITTPFNMLKQSINMIKHIYAYVVKLNYAVHVLWWEKEGKKLTESDALNLYSRIVCILENTGPITMTTHNHDN